MMWRQNWPSVELFYYIIIIHGFLFRFNESQKEVCRCSVVGITFDCGADDPSSNPLGTLSVEHRIYV